METDDDFEPQPDRSPWVICPYCDGEGHHAKELGSFTMSEFNELFDDDESKQGYFDGAYDKPCQVCNSSGKIRESQCAEAEEKIAKENRRLRMLETGRNEIGEPL